MQPTRSGFIFLLMAALFIVGCNETGEGRGDEGSPVPVHPPLPLQGGEAERETVIFRSGFESGVTIAPPVDRSGQWWQLLSGADAGYNWTSHLPARGANSGFQYLVPAGENIDHYGETRIEEVIGPKGAPTKVLYMAVKAYDQSGFGRGWLTRNQYNLVWDSSRNQAYARYWMKLQPDLETLMPPGESAWRNLMEWREGGGYRDDYRWSLLIIRNPRVHPRLFWKVEAEEVVPERKIDWSLKNLELPVPVGEWFLLEVFWKLSQGDEGRVWVAVNGQTIADYHGRTQKDSNLGKWHPFKVYTGASSLEHGPAYQWIDELEIHTDIPAGR